MKKYQDEIVDGQVIQEGGRDCASRYEMIRPILAKFRRRFTLLDFGANVGYFSFRAAHEFPNAVCVMIEGGKYADRCLELCKRQSLSNIVLMRHKFDPSDIELLKSVEPFDVALCLSTLHHFGSKCTHASEAAWGIADQLVVENPDKDDVGAKGYGSHLNDLTAWWNNCSYTSVLGFASRGTSDVRSRVTWYRFNRTSTSSPYVDATERQLARYTRREKVKIESTNTSRRYQTPKVNRDWIAGINLSTFLHFGGVWPDRDRLKTKVLEMVRTHGLQHGDLTPRNIIMDGKDLHPIDSRDPPWNPENERAKILGALSRDMLEETNRHFEKGIQ